MNDKLREQIEQFAEDNNMGTYFDDEYVELEFYSDLGEDMIVGIHLGECENFHDFARELRNYAEDFDIDDDLKLQMGIDYISSSTTIEEVYEDAKIINDALENLQIELNKHEISTYDELFDIANDIADVRLSVTNDWVSLNVGTGFSREYEIEDSENENADVDKIVAEIKELYNDFYPSDYTREVFGVSLDDAMNGLPEDIGALLQDKKEIKEHLAELADKADEMAEEIEKDQKKNKDIER